MTRQSVFRFLRVLALVLVGFTVAISAQAQSETVHEVSIAAPVNWEVPAAGFQLLEVQQQATVTATMMITTTPAITITPTMTVTPTMEITPTMAPAVTATVSPATPPPSMPPSLPATGAAAVPSMWVPLVLGAMAFIGGGLILRELRRP